MIAIRRLLDDSGYKSTVIGMSKGEIELDLNSIMVVEVDVRYS